MARNRVAIAICAVGIATFLSAACTLITDLDNLSGPRDVKAADSGPSASSNDGAAATDAPITSTTDTGTTTQTDSSPPIGAPCTDMGPIVGLSDLNALVADDIPVFTIDAYPFTANAAGVARCVWLWVERAPASGRVRVGVYAHDAVSNDPKALKRKALLINAKEKAWNSVALAEPLDVAQGEKLWLGIAPEKVTSEDVDWMRILMRDTNCPLSSPFLHAADIGETGDPPATFQAHTTYPNNCDAAVFLGR